VEEHAVSAVRMTTWKVPQIGDICMLLPHGWNSVPGDELILSYNGDNTWLSQQACVFFP
jgi:hypothetical protein